MTESPTPTTDAPRDAAPRPPRRRTLPPQSDRPFQLLLVVGPVDAADPSEAGLADSTTHLAPPTAVEAPAALAGTGISPADLRSRTVFLVRDRADLISAMCCYATATGFSARYLDVATPQGVVVAAYHRAGRELADQGKAPERADLVVVAGTGSRLSPDLPARVLGEEEAAAADVRVYSFGEGGLDHLDAAEVSELRSARRVVLCPSSDPTIAFRELLELAGARSKKNFERLPVVAFGDDIIDLDDMRRQGGELRKEHRGYTTAIAPRVEPSTRQRRLQAAASVEMPVLLAELGCASAGDLWQCPRPWNHTHGDATPSMQVSEENRVRCFVDDGSEWIDPLRLVMEVCDVTPDRAAQLLLEDREGLVPHRQRIDAERARRAA